MEKVELLKKRGISLRKLNIIMFVLAVVISTVLLFAMNRTNSLYKKNHKMTQTLYEWREDAYNLQLASDYLTEQIRCFAVSGDKQYLDNYFEEAEVTKRREIALDNIKRNHEDSPAVRELSEAMSESSHLMKREYYAARLAVEGYGYDLNDYPEVIRLVELSDEDKALSGEEQRYAASRYLFDEEYLTSKRRINDNMTDCLDRLEDEVSKKQAKVSKELETQVFIEHVFTFVLIGIMLGIVILTSILVFRPLRRCVELIRKEREIPLKGAYEVRFLAKNYNLMYYTTKENENKLNYEANHDKLTGLFNRRGYDFFLSNVDMETSSIIILDLDNFKDINDKYGHDVGDKVLANVAQVILHSFRSQDYVCRIGGDEFAVIMIRSDSTMKDLITRKVEHLNEVLSNPSDENIPPVTCSVGVAFGKYGITVSELFKRADRALYQSKDGGKRCVSFYSNKSVRDDNN